MYYGHSMYSCGSNRKYTIIMCENVEVTEKVGNLFATITCLSICRCAGDLLCFAYLLNQWNGHEMKYILPFSFLVFVPLQETCWSIYP